MLKSRQVSSVAIINKNKTWLQHFEVLHSYNCGHTYVHIKHEYLKLDLSFLHSSLHYEC